jgi:hypothetical protein
MKNLSEILLGSFTTFYTFQFSTVSIDLGCRDHLGTQDQSIYICTTCAGCVEVDVQHSRILTKDHLAETCLLCTEHESAAYLFWCVTALSADPHSNRRRPNQSNSNRARKIQPNGPMQIDRRVHGEVFTAEI